MKLSQNGFEFLKSVEGKMNKPYWDNDAYSVGYGHHGKDIDPNKIYTDKEIEDFFQKDKIRFEREVSKIFREGEMSQNQFDAMFSFAYNVGHIVGTELGTMIATNPHNPKIRDFWEYTWTNKRKNQGLVKRRQKEAELYFKRDNS